MKRKRPSWSTIWLFGEVASKIRGEKRCLRRAVDRGCYVLDEIVQLHRDAKAVQRLLMRLLAEQGCRPKRIITDKLGSAALARKAFMPNVEYRSRKAPNSRAESSHAPLRKRERQMQGFRSRPALPRFAETLSTVRDGNYGPISKTSSTSTGMPSGKLARPSTMRAESNSVPKTLTRTSEAPSATLG